MSKDSQGKYCSIRRFNHYRNYLQKAEHSSKLSNILVGTSNSKSDDILVTFLQKRFQLLQGSLEDVMARFASICNHYKPDYVVRITGDCPLIDYTIMDKCIDEAVSEQ